MPIRITGGKFRGQTISSPAGRIRPTAARVRQSLFDILGDVAGLSFCDLYAGSGAVGIEAASRGASPVEFVESDRRAARAIRRDLGRLGFPPEAARIRPETVERWSKSDGKIFDIIFADPPYIDGVVERLFGFLPGILKRVDKGGLLVIQLRASMIDFAGDFEIRRFGDDILCFLRKPDFT